MSTPSQDVYDVNWSRLYVCHIYVTSGSGKKRLCHIYVTFNKPGGHCIRTKDCSRISAAQFTPLFDHPPYSPDLAPNDFHLFLKLKEFLRGKRFGSDEELENAVTTWLNELVAEECDMGILKLADRYDKCLNVGGDYVEK
ncbi:hypothetical protein AVEN_203231-1 [Araneus ventricosus]|uniref:Histone-lysine N-methyltransferase SETMAR n=1 Tax=Araneus ventricosus TaxID=182803 RepID=A0A4Y2F3F1_ARAVE|nr:hypothetical protein AVEN_203231-1 [Araneus ventricosus]